MSNFEPLSVQPEWRESYSPYPINRQNAVTQPTLEQSTTPNVSNNNQAHQLHHARVPIEHRHSLDPMRREPQPISPIERPASAVGDNGNQANISARDDSHVSTESSALSLGSIGSHPLSSASSAPSQQEKQTHEEGENNNVYLKEEEDEDDDDDDDMLDIEEGAAPQTAAERRAERRKMKRFRYESVFQHHLYRTCLCS